jgi:hypothetical protein
MADEKRTDRPRPVSVDAAPEGWAERMAQLWFVGLPVRVGRRLRLLGLLLSDGIWLAAWPPVAALAAPAGFGLGFVTPFVRPLMEYVFTESLLFLLLAISGSMLSGQFGLFLLVGYAVGEVVGRADPAGGRDFGLLADMLRRGGSHLVSTVVLAILVVGVPFFARVAGTGGRYRPGTRAALAWRAGWSAAVGAALTFAWSQAAAAMVRPAFTFLGRQPTVPAIFGVQRRWPWLVAMAVLAAVLRVVLEAKAGRSRTRVFVAHLRRLRWAELSMAKRAPWPEPVRIAAFATIATFLLAGLYEAAYDAIVVALVVAAGEWLRARLYTGGGRMAGVLAATPLALRIVLAVGLAFAAARVVIGALWSTGSMRTELAGVLAAAVPILLLLPRPVLTRNRPASAPAGVRP